jgi:hypothetical protein
VRDSVVNHPALIEHISAIGDIERTRNRMARGAVACAASEDWRARQDSNLRPDRYEREDKGRDR